METYRLVYDGLKGYGVEVASSGAFLSVRGFLTEAAASEWIAKQKARDLREENERTVL